MQRKKEIVDRTPPVCLDSLEVFGPRRVPGRNPEEMLPRSSRRDAGGGNLQFLLVIAILSAACYVGIKMGRPYFAYRSLERTMEQWATITLYKGGSNYSDLHEKIQWSIERHRIPLNMEDVEIVYDPEQEMLGVYAEYDVYVDFPGYQHHYFFQPYAEVYADED